MALRLKELDDLKTDFLAKITHDLRNPLGAVIGYAEVMLLGIKGPVSPEQQKCLKLMVSNADYLSELINNILDLMKVKADEYGVALVQDLSPGFPQAEADPQALRRVLVNLVSNALKFTPQGGQVRISASVESGGGLCMTVHDRRDLPRQVRGTGLGLAICKEIVESHGGRIWAESQPGRGGRAVMSLRLLIADDSPEYREILSGMARSMGWEAQVCPDGASAIETARRVRPQLAILDIGLPDMDGFALCRGLRALPGAETVQLGLHLFRTQGPDLVILDVHLPDGTGFSVCEAIRKSRCGPATPVIMLTAASKLEEKAQGFSAGADHYLVKPVHPKELLMWVVALLKRLELDKEPRRTLVAEDLVIELDSQLVRFKGVEISGLTGKEFDLLYFLARSRPRILSRKYILSTLWHTVTVDHVVDTHISDLRRKVPPELSDRIQSIPGKGFRYLG